MDPNNEIDPILLNKLKSLNKIDVTRDPKKAAEGRAIFLHESEEIAQHVSPQENRRHKNWNQKDQSQFMQRRKERAPMLSTLTSILLAITIFLGGTGITVAAAQSSLPEDTLYDLKLFTETLLMDVTSSPDSQFDLALDLVDRRADEIIELVSSGEIPTDETQTRYRDQVEQAIVLALNLLPENVLPAFEKIQIHLQTQEEAFTQIQNNGTETAIMALAQTRNMVQERLQILENGQYNMLQTQQQQQLQEQIGNPDQQSTSQSDQGTQTAPGTGGGNPWTTGIPTPGSSYGSGESNNPWMTGTPTPNSGYGPGDGTGECTTCTPTGNSQGGSIQPTKTQQKGPNGGSGNH